MAENNYGMEVGDDFYPNSPPGRKDHRGDAARFRRTSNAHAGGTNNGNGTSITTGCVITNIGYVPGGYRQVRCASDLAHSETASIHDVRCPTETDELPFNPTDGFHTKVHRGEFDGKATDAPIEGPASPRAKRAYELAAEAQARYNKEEVNNDVANPSIVAHSGAATLKPAGSILGEGLTKSSQVNKVFCTLGIRDSDRISQDASHSIPSPSSGPAVDSSPLDTSMTIGDLCFPRVPVGDPSKSRKMGSRSMTGFEDSRGNMTPAAAESVVAARVGQTEGDGTAPITIKHNDDPPRIPQETVSRYAAYGRHGGLSFKYIHEWNQNNKNENSGAVPDHDGPSGSAAAVASEAGASPPDVSLCDGSYLFDDGSSQHDSEFSMVEAATLEDDHLRATEPAEPKSHFSVSDESESSSEDSDDGRGSSDEVPIKCKVEDLDPAGVVAYIEERRRMILLQEANGLESSSSEEEDDVEDAPRGSNFKSQPDKQNSSAQPTAPTAPTKNSRYQAYVSDEITAEQDICTHTGADHHLLSTQPGPSNSGSPRHNPAQSSKQPNLTIGDLRSSIPHISTNPPNGPTIIDTTMREILTVHPDLADMEMEDSDVLDYCKKCGENHISRGSPLTLSLRDTCGASLPEWFPADRFTNPVRAWQCILNKSIELEEILKGYGHPHPRRPEWKKQFHEPSALFEGLRSEGGWWNCRKDDAAPIAEKLCDLCHKDAGGKESLTQEQFLQVVAEEKKQIDDFIADGTRKIGERDRELVLKRMREEGSPLTWKN
ncbi:hypothetical protein PVAG01_10077 [Phlyctema vagabunda]|uniref:Uncharacterized protein n=1 Tax=Phlyctema vagabunda TaxID=108571 RepID=A0ABR4P4Y8_9HELO